MNFSLKSFFLLLIMAGLWSGCSSEMRENLKSVPTAFGKVNEIIVIADDNIWDSPLGDTIRYYLSSAYIILPQPEPIFDLRHYTLEDLREEPLLKNFRSYLIVANLNDESSPTTQMVTKDLGSEKMRTVREGTASNISIGRDKWAKDQLLIYQMGLGHDALVEHIRTNAAAMAQRVNKHDRSIVEANIYQGGTNNALSQQVKDRLGVDITVPYDFYLALDDTTDQTVWLRRETDFSSLNIMLHKYPYTSQDQLTREGIKTELNNLGLYVSTDIEATYKQINDVDLPLYISQKEVGNRYAQEVRGIWEIANDFMGGPFISYAILNPERNEILLAEGFVHAPGKDKRDFMQRLEYIFSEIKF